MSLFIDRAEIGIGAQTGRGQGKVKPDESDDEVSLLESPLPPPLLPPPVPPLLPKNECE